MTLSAGQCDYIRALAPILECYTDDQINTVMSDGLEVNEVGNLDLKQVVDALPRLSLDYMYFAVTKDAEGHEAMCYVETTEGEPNPLMASTHRRLPLLQDFAQRIATESRRTVTIIKLEARKEIAVFDPL